MVRAALRISVIATVGGSLAVFGAARAASAHNPDPSSSTCPWSNQRLTADQRAHLLLNASTLEQKERWLDEQAANNPTQTTFGGVTYPVQVACTPTVVYTDGPDYDRGSTGVTVFPAQIALASSWNQSLAYAKGKAQADEAFRSGKNVILGPGISSSRTPLAGRTPEYLGEDSLLSGDMAAAMVNGIQNGNPAEPVGAVLKHFIANEQELDRQTSSSNIDGRTLREVYNLPFEIAVAKSHPAGVMCSYNQVNGVYACENPILTNLLKHDDGMDGYVTSDFGAVHTTAQSLNAGLDQELNRPKYYSPANLGAAIDAGQVTVSQIDAAAFRVVRAYIREGLFDHPLPTVASTSSSTAQDKALAVQEAEAGSVLLKNDANTLPLTAADKTVAVIGQTASNTPTNGVSAGTVCAEGGPTPFGNSGPACPDPVAPLDAITTRAASSGANVVYNNGSDPASAAQTASGADAAVVFVYEKQGEFTDRTNLGLDGNGEDLIDAVSAANPNTIVVLETGTAVTMPWLDKVRGVIEAWYPGDQQGTALARLLYGDDNFSGRLPMTFPKSLTDVPTNTPAQYPGLLANGTTTRQAGDTSIRQVSYSEGLAVGYKWYDSQAITPLFPFGYGLSYTNFRYSDLSVAQRGSRIQVAVTVTNTGSVSGVSTPQIYLTLPASSGEPGKRLVGFAQVSLRPGQSSRISADIDAGAPDHPLSVWNTTAHAWSIPSGVYQVQVGQSSRELPLSETFTIG